MKQKFLFFTPELYELANGPKLQPKVESMSMLVAFLQVSSVCVSF